ncbi:MAG: hypothetical protein RJB65_1683 [Actinomycetota bacterium]
MSTIRKYGVAFHLIPTMGDELWVEAVRESDGAVVSSGVFKGDSEDDFSSGVDNWFADVVDDRLAPLEVLRCRACGRHRRDVRAFDGRLTPENIVEYEFDICAACAAGVERNLPWMRAYLTDRYPEAEYGLSSDDEECDEDDDW